MGKGQLENREWQEFPGISRVDANSGGGVDERDEAVALFQLATIRHFEQWLLDNEELVHGPVHSSIGQEAVAVGAVAGLKDQDFITSTHRAHHHVLAKVMSYSVGADFDPSSDDLELPSELTDVVYRTMAEILGLRDGWAGGRGGSMHLSSPEFGVLATSAIVGGGIPIAAGAALAAKFRGEDSVSLAFFGDGAASIGAFHEGMSMAKACGLPTIFLIDNNLYSVATTVMETVGFEDIVIRAAGQNIPGLLVDGMDPMAVREAVRIARDHAISTSSPVLIEAKAYRYFHQSGGLRGSAFRYRSEEEEDYWSERDPILTFPEQILNQGVLGQEEVERVLAAAEGLVAGVVGRCAELVEGSWVIPGRHQPDVLTAEAGVVSDGREFVGVGFVEPADLPAGREVAFGDAISRVIHRTMERDPEVFVLGEEVSHLRGGAYGSTRHALRSFPNRVISTPIAENGFSGVALGAAMVGMRPIVEIMFPDFALEAADQLLNHIPKTRYMFGGKHPVPLVVRTRTAQGRGYGPQHSSDPAALFGLFPGWRIVAPSSPADYVGLFNTAMLSEDPVLVIEHHLLWPMKGPLPEGDLDYMIPFGKANTVKQGEHVTVATWSHPLHRVLNIAVELEEDGVSVEVLDLRTLDRSSLDTALIVESARRTGALAIVEDATVSHSLGAQIVDRLQSDLFGILRHPITRVTGKDVPAPVSKVLEDSVRLKDEEITEQLRYLAS